MLRVCGLCLLLAITGCDLKVSNNNAVKAVPASPEATVIADSMTDVSKEDAVIIYKQFAGLTSYLGSTKKISSTSELVAVIGRFQSDYGYTREKYRKFTDAVEVFLVKQGYKTPKSIVENSNGDKEVSRSKVIEDMKVIADGSKIAVERIESAKNK